MEHTFIISDPVVDGFEGAIAKHLYSLFTAIKHVSVDYIRYAYHSEIPESILLSEDSKKRSEAEISHVERVFAYELYRQWCNQVIIGGSSQFVVNAEIPKVFSDTASVDCGHLCYPDMVLHSGQNQNKGNIIVCEIKRKEYVDLYPKQMNDDIKKLCIYVDDESRIKKRHEEWAPYNLGVFLMIVKSIRKNKGEKYSLDLISNHLNTENKALKNKLSKKIVCAIYDGHKLIYDTLYNINNK